MIKNVTIDNDVDISIKYIPAINLSFYAKNNIPNYDTIIEIPKENMDYINSVKYAVNCKRMFAGCIKLTSLDISKFDTSEVTDMDGMFGGCGSLTTLDLSNFDTSKVVNIHHMFSVCRLLKSLDLSNWDTSKVTDMSFMFSNCTSLTSVNGVLDLSSCRMLTGIFDRTRNLKGVHLKNVPRSLLNTDGSLKSSYGTLNQTYIIDNVLDGK